MDFNFLNLILKDKRGGRLQNILQFLDRAINHCLGSLCLLLFYASYHLLNRIICSSRLIRNVRISLFLLGPKVVSIWVLLHIIFIIPMTVNDVNLYVVFRGVSGLSS
jgi:hypothetical protein